MKLSSEGICSTQSASPIERELQEARNLYNDVHSAISMLEGKLMPALVVYPESCAKAGDDKVCEPPLLAAIKDINMAMRAMHSRIADITERCIL